MRKTALFEGLKKRRFEKKVRAKKKFLLRDPKVWTTAGKLRFYYLPGEEYQDYLQMFEGQTEYAEYAKSESFEILWEEGGYILLFDSENRQDFGLENSDEALILKEKNGNEKYVLLKHPGSDEILEKYKIDQHILFSILAFKKNELEEIYLIRKGETGFCKLSSIIPGPRKGNEKPRILQAPIIALYTPGYYVRGMRELGYQCDQMIMDYNGWEWLLEYTPDFSLDINSTKLSISRARRVEFMVYSLKEYDIYHLHSNWGMLGFDPLWPLNADYPFLKKVGKKIVHSSWGWCDDATPEYSFIGQGVECDYCTQLKPIRCENEEHISIIRTTYKYADKIMTNMKACLVHPEIVFMDNAIDCDKWSPDIRNNMPDRFRLGGRPRLRVYHAFGNSRTRDDVKGTEVIKETVTRLQKEGYDIEFLFFDNVKHGDIRYFQVQADIVIDQLYTGWHGSNGVECLALGKPVLTYVMPQMEEYLKKMNRECALVNVTRDTLYDVLKELIENEDKRLETGKKSREYALRYHDYRVVARKLEKEYVNVYGGFEKDTEDT